MGDCMPGNDVHAQTNKTVNDLHTKMDRLSHSMHVNNTVGGNKQPEKKRTYDAPSSDSSSMTIKLVAGLLVIVFALVIATLALTANAPATVGTLQTTTTSMFNNNICDGKKPKSGFDNFPCSKAVADAIEQAGADVTAGYVGDIDASATPPITVPYYQKGLCPVNVHWHLGAEHRSGGQFDEKGKGPVDDYAKTAKRRLKGTGPVVDGEHRRLADGGVREGHQCYHYDEKDAKYTTPFQWKHCIDMMVGQTYEIHWPHSAAGACGTPYQYQTPFYDGVFCKYGGQSTHDHVGVQSQVFTVVNDEKYYYPDLMKGMIVDGDFGKDVAYYTGSTTGTTRSNEVCSAYSPITWQVDRKCHLISASSFDKLCADMKSQVDDMSKDLYAHGAREVVSKSLAAKQQP